ncbi:MAG: dTDP-4-dehydrorhamnose 3,5-epimerase [Anaerolineae bacterium]|nr:dTDP-4-dehydrorhamnose 3,5-epimerase [Anaerolineae bacterium]
MPFELHSVYLDAVKVLVPTRFEDHRGYFMEAYRQDQFLELGLPGNFVQDNFSHSTVGVIRGLHFQWHPPMGKLMRVVYGRAFLVAVDLRVGSPTLGHWFGVEASAENNLQVWAPASFARGFCALSETAGVLYKCTGTYSQPHESGIRWDDPTIGIEWPVKDPVLSAKDASAQSLAEWLARPEAQHFTYAPATP